jgi:hypothetical protein
MNGRETMRKEYEPELDDEGVDAGDYDFGGEGEEFNLEDFEAMGINPIRPTGARPGSEEKVLMLSARYAAGLPLWHDQDCYDHGPRETELMGLQPALAEIPVTLDDDSEEVDEE